VLYPFCSRSLQALFELLELSMLLELPEHALGPSATAALELRPLIQTAF
jgi:hypothetical protein